MLVRWLESFLMHTNPHSTNSKIHTERTRYERETQQKLGTNPIMSFTRSIFTDFSVMLELC